MNWLTDAHIHLSDIEFSNELEHLFIAMGKMNLRACCVSIDYESSKTTLDLALRNPLILPFIGIHPEKATDYFQDIKELIESNSKRISGIGEIGLDRTYVNDERGFTKQVTLFREMLSLAENFGKPVSIHSRKTLDEIFSIISSYSLKGILLHWFEGNKKQLRKAMDLNCFVSYGPAMVYSKDKQVLLSQTDEDKILLETDGPVKFSKCFGYKTAQITFLPSVLFCAANILRKSYDEMLVIIEKNTNYYLEYRYKKPL